MRRGPLAPLNTRRCNGCLVVRLEPGSMELRLPSTRVMRPKIQTKGGMQTQRISSWADVVLSEPSIPKLSRIAQKAGLPENSPQIREPGKKQGGRHSAMRYLEAVCLAKTSAKRESEAPTRGFISLYQRLSSEPRTPDGQANDLLHQRLELTMALADVFWKRTPSILCPLPG